MSQNNSKYFKDDTFFVLMVVWLFCLYSAHMWSCVLVLAGFPSSDAGTGDASSKSLLRSSCSSSL